MPLVFALTRHSGIRLAEVGFLLILIAGIWLASSQIFSMAKMRMVVSGLLLAVGGALLIVATHWGHFG